MARARQGKPEGYRLRYRLQATGYAIGAADQGKATGSEARQGAADQGKATL